MLMISMVLSSVLFTASGQESHLPDSIACSIGLRRGFYDCSKIPGAWDTLQAVNNYQQTKRSEVVSDIKASAALSIPAVYVAFDFFFTKIISFFLTVRNIWTQRSKTRFKHT